jgi:hypothetical protein
MPGSQPGFLIILRSEAGSVPAVVRLRRFLKSALRGGGFEPCESRKLPAKPNQESQNALHERRFNMVKESFPFGANRKKPKAKTRKSSKPKRPRQPHMSWQSYTGGK